MAFARLPSSLLAGTAAPGRFSGRFAAPALATPAPFAGWTQWFARLPGRLAANAGQMYGPASVAQRTVSGTSHASRASAQARSAAPVVRVLRVIEAGDARRSAGRMVISGRMADVCAELDRLASAEARLQA